MASYADLLVSFFSLVKNNNGFFKSEKQAAFLLKMTDGEYVTTQNLHFGEYEGRTDSNTAKIEWTVKLDSQGVIKMVKTTSKGSQVYFERTPEFFEKIAAQKAAMAADMEAIRLGRLEFVNGKLQELKEQMGEYKKELAIAMENKEFLSQQTSPVTSCANLYDFTVKVLNKEIASLEKEIETLSA